MASHDVARLTTAQIEERRQTDAEKIQRYRALEDTFRQKVADNHFDQDTFQLTSKLLRLNPEYYTVWNARRRCLTFGLLSKPSAGSSPSTVSPSGLASATQTCSSGASLPLSSAETPLRPDPQKTGSSGTTAEEDSTGDNGTRDDKRQSQVKDLEIIRSELEFTIPLLIEHPKCYWIWKYRWWILNQAVERFDKKIATAIWYEELGLVSKMLHRDRRNFHAWGYRRLVVAKLESSALDGYSLVESEFEYTTKMIGNDLSNFSAWHNRSRLIPLLLDERAADDAARKIFLDKELNIIREALNVGPEDQSLWLYHQSLIHSIVDPNAHPIIAPDLALEQRKSYIEAEIEFIDELLEDYTDIKWIYEALMEYTLAISRLEGQRLSAGDEANIVRWLNKVKELDGKRSGRWGEYEAKLGFA